MAPGDAANTVDVLVVGTGAGGMTAALVAKARGLDVMVVEKASTFGGTTSTSGGGIWAPNAPVIVRDRGTSEDPQAPLTYLQHITGGEVPQARLETLVREVPQMLAYLESLSPDIRFERKIAYPDYYPEAPGGSAESRSIHAVPLDLRKLGEEEKDLHGAGRFMGAPKGAWVTSNDLEDLISMGYGLRGKLGLLKVIGRMVRTRITGERIAGPGQSLIARLRLAQKALGGIPIWLDTPMRSLMTGADGAVTGAIVEHQGQTVEVKARAVILASGGFDHNLEMRKKYQPAVQQDWSAGIPELTGDGILAGQQVGAAIDLMDDAWWVPVYDKPGGTIGLCGPADRSIPGLFVVNGAGERYVNEAAAYHEFGQAMIRQHRESGIPHIPSWVIIDDKSWRTYMFSGHFPLPKIPFSPVPTGQEIPPALIKEGLVQIASSWEELAGKIGVPADALRKTAERFNALARKGRDEDFGKGDSVHDHYYGDPRLPNPNLAEVIHPPFYAFKIHPGDLGTKGGIVTDEHARALTADGSVIAGLYAVGNTSAAVMGRSYAGPGATISSAMTFAYVAANHIAGKN
ncbi:FAD-dependent oxidoreductase [Novosphingobium malaysiense]|uniref:3-ketosteroid-delta-1-dehydrogenase n=1 Tax=Novosphingobium malaysiense TaxID=1348853 RepID=A0A0B1ZM49_9SPHN|nr:FAD-dependent oxidoreductase [Novosphingobium malaysiense]KHK90360.1 3-ketosteroid-delta-1-dehydrogenase [Novosphingobium malaysiense]